MAERPILFRDARLVDPVDGGAAGGTCWSRTDGIAAPAQGAAGAGGGGLRAAACWRPASWTCKVFVGEPGARHRESYRTAGAGGRGRGRDHHRRSAGHGPGGRRSGAGRLRPPPCRRGLPGPRPCHGRADRGLPAARGCREMGFLQDAGAVAFTDGDRPVADACRVPPLPRLREGHGRAGGASPAGAGLERAATCATESFFATKLGLPAMPAMAERIDAGAGPALAGTDGGAAACRPALDRRRARRRWSGRGRRELAVTAGASIHHLTLNELDIEHYRTFFRLDPPLRSEDDRGALVQAVAEGLVEVITSAHCPGRGAQAPAL